MLLIGVVGFYFFILCKLVFYVVDVFIYKMDIFKRSNFFDGLRFVVRLCGLEGKILVLFFIVSVL